MVKSTLIGLQFGAISVLSPLKLWPLGNRTWAELIMAIPLDNPLIRRSARG